MASSIPEWLESLGLGKYVEAFSENDIDLEVLPDLTESDLQSLGVSLGHRKKMLSGIKALTADDGSLDRVASSTAADTRKEQPSPHHDAERRQLTVMFCDLVGSTALSGQVDPEDYRAIIQAYQEACASVVTQYEGVIAKYMGDGIMVFFGYPQAHEDDAERAVRTGLGIVKAMLQLQPVQGLSLQVRVGIATGLVVVGDVVGKGVSEEQAVTGETPNLAARLQAQAFPNTVIISAATRNLVGRNFQIADLGLKTLKGIAEPVQIWSVIGDKETESRFEATHLEDLTPLIAREEEIDLMMGRWDLAKQGESQVILLSGEAGIGKSRIAQSLRERIANEPHTRLRYQCSPYHTNGALFPIISQLELAARFTPDDSVEDKLEKLEKLMGRPADDTEKVISILAALLSIPTGDRYPSLGFDPQRLKEKTLEVLLEQLLGLAAVQPVLFIFEDAHWVDPTTLEFLNLVVDRTETAQLLVVITFRSEFSPPWVGHTHVTSLALNRLGRRNCEAMVRKVTAGRDLPAEVLDQLVAKTDGMPLFIEELTKTVLESGLLKLKNGRYELTGPLPPLAIPTSLQDSLMARLDRLAPVKEVAQIGAVIGREFSYELLSAVSPLPQERLQDALAQLVNAQLVFKKGTPSQPVFTFKHALVQDTAYQSLLKSKRQQFHQQIANTLVDRFPGTAQTQPELLAHHFTEANLTERAIDYWRAAGQRSTQRSATVEAVTQLSKALALLDGLPQSVERDRRELDLRIDLTTPLIASKGMAAPEMGRTITRARTLCERLGETTRLFPVLYGQWVFHHVSGQVARGLEFAEEAARLAEHESSEVPRMVAHRTLGIGLIGLGKPAAARDHLERGNQLYDPERHRSLALVYGMDFLEVNLAYLALAQWFLGLPEQAIEANRETISHARSLSHPNSLCHALSLGAGTLSTFSRRFDEAKKIGEELLRVSAEHNMPQWSLFGRMYVAFGKLAEGEVEEGTSMLQDCLSRCRAVPMKANFTLALTLLAESQAKDGATQEALRSLEEAESVIAAGGERWAESAIWRIKADIYRGLSADGEATSALRHAIEIAQGQGAKILELRAATSLARLWRDQGKGEQARDLLAPLYGWFTEGFDTTDLKEAKALLCRLT